jgi:hypothetical protein
MAEAKPAAKKKAEKAEAKTAKKPSAKAEKPKKEAKTKKE